MLGSPSVGTGIVWGHGLPIDLVFASSDFGAYYAVNTNTGQMVWDFINPTATEFIVSSPIYANGNLYVLDVFNIVCLNAGNGHENWSAYTGDELYVSPSYADGKIYMATSERHILVMDTAKNGERTAIGYTASSSWSSPAIANGMLYIGCNDWNIYCFSEGATSQSSNNAATNNVALGHDLVLVVAAVAAIAVVVLFAATFASKKKTEKTQEQAL